jgi:hypothetical protein
MHGSQTHPEIKLLRRTFVSNTLNKKRTTLAGTAARRQERTQFCSISTRARFHTACATADFTGTAVSGRKRIPRAPRLIATLPIASGGSVTPILCRRKHMRLTGRAAQLIGRITSYPLISVHDRFALLKGNNVFEIGIGSRCRLVARSRHSTKR